MIVYLGVILFCFILYYQKKEVQYYNLYSSILIFILGFILCSGWTTGSDWRSYELAYYDSTFCNLFDSRMEVGYQLYASIFNFIGISFWPYLICTKFLVFWIIVHFARSHNVPISIYFMLLLPSIGYYLFIDNPLRSFISLGFWFVSIKYLYDRKFKTYLLLTLAASLFHLTALFMLPLYFLARVRIKGWIILISFIVFSIVAYKLDFLFQKINFILSYSEMLSSRMGGYLTLNQYTSSSINVGTIHRFFFLILLLAFRKKIEEYNEYSKLICNLAMISFIIYPFGMSIYVLQRFSLFVSPFVEISAIYALMSISKTNFKTLLMFVFLSYSILRTILLVTSDYRYIPYTNYFISLIKGNNFNYSERDMFNFVNSPYNN